MLSSLRIDIKKLSVLIANPHIDQVSVRKARFKDLTTRGSL